MGGGKLVVRRGGERMRKKFLFLPRPTTLEYTLLKGF